MNEIYKPEALKARAPIYIYEGTDDIQYTVNYKDRIGGKPFTEMQLAKRVIGLVERETNENIKESNANLR